MNHMTDQHGSHDRLPDDLTPNEVAELYAAGALTPGEARAFEERVRAGDGPYVAALREVQPAMERLLGMADAADPPASVRASLLARLGKPTAPSGEEAHEEWGGPDADPEEELLTTGASTAGILISTAATGRWRRTGLPGVRYRTLMADRRANRRTILLDMAPGTALPDHSHAGVEEVFMIRGDLHIAGAVLREHDHIRIDPGAHHGVPRTEQGCLCIVISDYVPFPAASLLGFVWTALKSLFGGQNRSRS